jgi:hypothetical protein
MWITSIFPRRGKFSIFMPENKGKVKNYQNIFPMAVRNISIVREEIQVLMETIQEQHEVIRHLGGKIPQIELDILLENVRKLYEDLKVLQGIQNPQSKEETTAGKGTVDKPLERKKDPVPPVRETRTAPPVKEEIKMPLSAIPETPVEPAEPEAKKPGKKLDKNPEIPLFPEDEFSIKLKEARTKTMGPKPSEKRPESLKARVGINDKFLFINELFNGNLREYNESIETLNGFRDLNSATGFLDLLIKQNHWDTGGNAFRRLTELLEKHWT